MCSVDAGTVIAVVAAIGAAYTTAALKLRRPDDARTRRDDGAPPIVERRARTPDGPWEWPSPGDSGEGGADS